MASPRPFGQNDAQPRPHDDESSHRQTDTFEVSEPNFRSGRPSRYERDRGWWIMSWITSIRKKRKQHEDDGEEQNGLLASTTGSFSRNSKENINKMFCRWCTYSGNTALSFLFMLIILNLLFGFATFLQSPKRPDPFTEWGRPGTSSEGLSWYPTDFLRDVVPKACHSHNDYWRNVPLFSALYAGCIGVEADVWAFDGDLFVGHNTASLTSNRTLQSLYIKPLLEILKRQNPSTPFYSGKTHGVFDTSAEQSLTLLIDLKTNGAETWPLVLEQLEPLRQRGWLSYMENGRIYPRPITVVGTGETPFDLLTANQTYRDTFFDAPLDQMLKYAQPGMDNIDDSIERSERQDQGSSGTSSADSYDELNSYYASTSFAESIGTVWWGKLSDMQIRLIRGQVSGAHLRGLKARYWNLPAWPRSLRNYIWDVLVNEGVDLLNVDDLDAVRDGVW